MLTALAFMLVNIFSYLLCLRRGPFWGLFAYINIYFNPPDPLDNWWANFLPFTRWSLLTTAVLFLSLIIHWSKTSDREFGHAKWAYAYFFLSLFTTLTVAVNQTVAFEFQYLFFSYCLIIFVIVKSLRDEYQLKWFLLANVAMSAFVSLGAYLYGKRENYRLEGSGTTDANGSNEFALLLASIVPFVIVFIRNGSTVQRVIALLSFPLILNAFILCNSRGATIAFVLAMIVSALIVGDKKVRRGIMIMTVVAAPMFVYLVDEAYIDRFSTLLGLGDAIENEQELDSLSSGRIAIWGYGLQMVADHPLGAGSDGFRELAHVYMPEDMLSYRIGYEYGKRAAHNTYLQVLVEQGFVGLGLWLAMCLSICLSLKKYFKLVSNNKKLDPFWRNLVFALTVSFLTTLSGGLVTNRVYYEFFWWQIAVVAVVIAMVRKLLQKEASVDDQLTKAPAK